MPDRLLENDLPDSYRSWLEERYLLLSALRKLANRDTPKVFQWMSLALPARLYKEDLGDALELLAWLERVGAPRWQRGLKIACTCFWLLINTVRELTSVVHGAGVRQKVDGR